MPFVRIARAPAGLRAAAIEYRARQIADPIERLRFLRTAASGQSRTGSIATGCIRIACLISVIVLACLFAAPLHKASSSNVTPARVSKVAPVAPTASPDVWIVEQRADFDLYSNGLRIENEFAVSGEPRLDFPVYSHDKGDQPAARGTEPAGVVFHSTESDQAAFVPSQARALTRIGRNLLQYVRSRQSYHFVIDRFGRVYRIVRETDKANHAGHSVWAGRQGALLNLNASFLAVAFEARTSAESPLNKAQIHSARLLTEMLRGAYRLDPSSFVTHAQVSVNPSNMRIGYHTDWATGLPFDALGLPDNYSEKIGSVALFGFGYDTNFVNAMGGTPWPGLLAASEETEHAAAGAGFSPVRYRKQLQQRYKRIMHAQLRMPEGSQHEDQPKH